MIKGNKDLSVGYLVIVLYKQEGDKKFRRILMGDGLTRGEADEIVEGIDPVDMEIPNDSIIWLAKIRAKGEIFLLVDGWIVKEGDKVQYKSKNRGTSPLCYKCGSTLVNNPLYNQVKSCPYCDRICGKCNGVGHRTEECDEYQRQQEICDKCGRTLWQHSKTGYSCEEWNENVDKICSVCGRSHPEGEEVCESNLIRDFLYSLDQQN